MTLGESGECRQRDPLGGRLGQRDPDLNEEARVEVGEQTDVDILEAGMAGLGDLLGREVAGGSGKDESSWGLVQATQGTVVLSLRKEAEQMAERVWGRGAKQGSDLGHSQARPERPRRGLQGH